ncbi:ribose-phosphate pyrophosphokinase [Aquisediminimonas profunda]|uniref:ribose-phosphate pyrophosphokinase n=1 Tax=Aquisediminimonas profunda TaxID=1550733 RepID=UPI001FEA5A8D|nr:ribose-phosphate pyrophosphokinase [Aquisediminimonas profunda]
MFDEFFDEGPVNPGAPLFDVALVERLLQDAARNGKAVSYSELLLELGYRFSRPKMRALCKVLDEIDRRGAARGEPELAALVVREGDGLPGQGWWVGRRDYAGAWTGPEARAFLSQVQDKTFSFWKRRAKGRA